MNRVKYFQEVMEIEAYVYTAGPIGTRWLQELKNGRLTAAYCAKCGKLFLPPKMFEPETFEEAVELRPIDDVGVVETYAVIHRGFDGEELKGPVAMAFIKFPGVEGGLVHYVKAKELRVGMRVRARWRPVEQRVGSITDIECFEPV
ncbi:MAG: Zn-ribbon domain-containing OB-fold protein [Thermoproteus sp. AZ2]|uniref:Zn-ribbon domain-containing OB-fold protein n=1 Tax=Thermoproteus sp. AZ2 TaxID=1609232 RepID=A0ACC6V007_9CREN